MAKYIGYCIGIIFLLRHFVFNKTTLFSLMLTYVYRHRSNAYFHKLQTYVLHFYYHWRMARMLKRIVYRIYI